MKPLPAAMTLSLGDGESATSFVSRMAAHLGRTTHEFCLDMGLEFQHVVDGHDQTLQAVAVLCRVDSEHLRQNAFIREAQGLSLMGQALIADSIDLGQLPVCPHCLVDDVQNGGGRPEVRPYGRSLWRLSSIRTCLRHHSPLISVSRKSDKYHLHDFSRIMLRSLSSLGELVDQTNTRRPTGLERYLANRLSGTGLATPWLDQLPFYAAAKVCEVIGAVAEFGLRVRFSTFSEDDWRQAGATGFYVAAQGEIGIQCFLAQLRDQFLDSKYAWGPGQMFGRLYHWLAHETDDCAYEPLRSLIYDFITETTPAGPGEVIFGREVTNRRLHSVRSASRLTGVPPLRLRSLLRAAGHIGDDAMKLTHDRVLFDALSTQEFLCAAADSMHLKCARAYLNAPRRHDRLLVESGFIQTLIETDGETLPNYAIRKTELDRFLSRLLEGAQELDGSSGEPVQIPLAAKRASCSPMKIVKLILDKQLQAYRSPAERGYLSVLVNLEDVKRLLASRDDGLLALKKAERMLGVHRTTMAGLVRHKILVTRSVINRNNGISQTMVKREDVQAFKERYVSLYALAREWRVGLPRLKKLLTAAGVTPAFDPGKTSTVFYERLVISSIQPH